MYIALVRIIYHIVRYDVLLEVGLAQSVGLMVMLGEVNRIVFEMLALVDCISLRHNVLLQLK